MGITIEMLDPLRDSRYERFVQKHSQSTIFHSSGWLKALEETYRYRPYGIAVFEGTEPIGLLTLLEVNSFVTGRRAVCLPFTDRCGPLIQDRRAVDPILSTIRELVDSRGWRYVEIREDFHHNSFAATSHFLSHQIRLESDANNVFRHFKRTHVQHIRKALFENIRVERRTDRAALSEFIRMNCVTRRKHGVPPQPEALFENLFEALLSSGRGFISLALLGSRPIAASVFFCFNRILTYKYAASDPERLAYCPNHLIVWDAVQWGCQNGFRLLDFGRTDDLDVGLLQYKRGWSPRESELKYFRSPAKPGNSVEVAYRNSNVVHSIVRISPMPLLKLAGQLIYRHVG